MRPQDVAAYCTCNNLPNPMNNTIRTSHRTQAATADSCTNTQDGDRQQETPERTTHTITLETENPDPRATIPHGTRIALLSMRPTSHIQTTQLINLRKARTQGTGREGGKTT
ncbi:Hypothetical predicted protein [Pelobates cultripes]|uniref:Uncharacterized protein n=1 Tax=Pelobates cultripes TaxID=61616 RepID=A0AAD1T997_PELCU|nr:Hypothetical predicted protein [Pelobates cultripes]